MESGFPTTSSVPLCSHRAEILPAGQQQPKEKRAAQQGRDDADR